MDLAAEEQERLSVYEQLCHLAIFLQMRRARIASALWRRLSESGEREK
jgi:hypothetical protein